jgi:DNA-binding CsgD family transcriptional regulator
MPTPKTNFQKSVAETETAKTVRWPAVRGFVVTDNSLAPLFANQEALAILTYPEPSSQNFAQMLQKKIRPTLADATSASANHNGHSSIMELKSGRRTYICRAFPLNQNGEGTGNAILFQLGRPSSIPVTLSRLSERFHLTLREQQAVALLLRGLSNKEMAQSMGISANTVKAFLRMATIKLGASSRSGIVTKLLGMLLTSGCLDLIQVDGSERSLDA